MATKSGLGRLTFSGRQEYRVARGKRPDGVICYVALCTCTLGNHYLAYDADGALIERTATPGTILYTFATPGEAQAAIETWQRQQAHNAAMSGETPQE